MKKFEFLPELPKPNLDDRKFEDLVAECILRIPRYCPEWTNYNPGDPGITLIELFAWLTDQMLMRFNQVPVRNYIVFLELLGIRLEPPKPAQTELTFYLTKARDEEVVVPKRTEVATERTENQEAVVFTTNQDLRIGTPAIKHFLTAKTPIAAPEDVVKGLQDLNVHDRTPNINQDEPRPQTEQWWNLGNIEEILLFEDSEPGNCFYLVLEDQDPEESLAGNIIVLTFRGESARTTGIDPEDPPLQWEAWTGDRWQGMILHQPQDDHTKGFSFQDTGNQSTNFLTEGADIILHLPQKWVPVQRGNYQGHWLRCVYKISGERQSGYSSSPSIVGMKTRAIGGVVDSSHCIQIQNELLGVSDGKPGQIFELQSKPVLYRDPEEEYIRVNLPWGNPSEEEGELSEDWKEVPNFANSGVDDSHYMIDSNTGLVQFGPLVREPGALKEQTQERGYLQKGGRIVRRSDGQFKDLLTPAPSQKSDVEIETLAEESQYGKIPPKGAEIYMVAYRTGGGKEGNVEAEKLTMLKSALPHIKNVINYQAATGGTEKESLDQAVIRVPELLRTRECAVTPDDFERVAKQAPGVAIARAHCLKDSSPGIVRLLLVRDTATEAIDWTRGMNPDDYFSLESSKQEIQHYIDEHKPLGVQVQLEEPEYVGVKVETEVILERKYRNKREQIERQLLKALYSFLNPLIGGIDEAENPYNCKGWPLGRPLYPSDIIALCQKIPGVSYLGIVNLYSIRKYGKQGWLCYDDTPEPVIEPGAEGLICSWDSSKDDPNLQSGYQNLESGHQISFVDS